MSSAAAELGRGASEPRTPVRRDATIIVLSTAELAECTCPDSCDRDHDRD